MLYPFYHSIIILSWIDDKIKALEIQNRVQIEAKYIDLYKAIGGVVNHFEVR